MITIIYSASKTRVLFPTVFFNFSQTRHKIANSSGSPDEIFANGIGT